MSVRFFTHPGFPVTHYHGVTAGEILLRIGRYLLFTLVLVLFWVML